MSGCVASVCAGRPKRGKAPHSQFLGGRNAASLGATHSVCCFHKAPCMNRKIWLVFALLLNSASHDWVWSSSAFALRLNFEIFHGNSIDSGKGKSRQWLLRHLSRTLTELDLQACCRPLEDTQRSIWEEKLSTGGTAEHFKGACLRLSCPDGLAFHANLNNSVLLQILTKSFHEALTSGKLHWTSRFPSKQS